MSSIGSRIGPVAASTRPRIAGQSQFYAGCAFLAIGLAGLEIARFYPLGTAARMGPGFFPVVLSTLLIVLGLLACLAGLRARTADRVQDWPIVPMLLIIGGVVGFGLLIEAAGLIVASAVLLTMACAQRFRSGPIEALILCLGLIAFVSALFVYALGMPIPLF